MAEEMGGEETMAGDLGRIFLDFLAWPPLSEACRFLAPPVPAATLFVPFRPPRPAPPLPPGALRLLLLRFLALAVVLGLPPVAVLLLAVGIVAVGCSLLAG